MQRAGVVIAGMAANIMFGIAACRPQKTSPVARAPDYRDIARSTTREVIRADSLRVESLELGTLANASDTLRFAITNESGAPRTVGVSIRVEPGLWVRGAWQRGYVISLQARERRDAALPYTVRRLTPEGRLLLTIGTPVGDSARIGVERPVVQRAYAVGRGNPAAVDPRPDFAFVRTAHFDVYAYRGSLAAHDIDRIAGEREHAVTQIGELIGSAFGGRVMLVFFPDSATKVNQTGHVGMGWATNSMIVEIYNERQKLDPYHELAHIVAGEAGSPPAVFDEGFATYASELLGADALEHLGHAGRTVDQATCDLARRGRRIPLDTLLRYTEFGSSEAPGDVTYPQGASLVKYLIETYGAERFRAAYRSVRAGDPNASAAFTRAFDATPAAVDSAWHARLHCSGGKANDQRLPANDSHR